MSIFRRGTLKPQHPLPAPTPEPVKPPKNIGRLAIIVGHSKKDGGASSVAPINMNEYTFHTKVIVPIMQAECEARGIEYRVFLRDGTDISGVGAAVSDWAKGYPKTCSIELHFNSASGNPQGSETLYDTNEKDNERFAKLVQNRMCQILKRTGSGDRGAKITNSGRGSHNLTSVKCTGCLVEPFFGNITSECKLMWDNHTAYARCLVHAAEDYLLSL